MITLPTRRLRAAIAATAIAAGGVGAAFATTGVGGAASDDASLTLFDPRTDVNETFYDLGEEGFSDGDIILETTSVVDPDSGEWAGSVVTRVHIIEGRVAPSDDDPIGDFMFYLDCTFELAGGNLTFAGPAEHTDLPTGMTFTVTGGTGDYAGARGEVTVQAGEVDGQEGGLITFNLID